MVRPTPETWGNTPAFVRAGHRLPIALAGNGFLRIASGASGVLVGLYLADLANRGSPVGAALVGTLGAVSFGAELLSSIPMGMLSDAISPRLLITSGALAGAVATQIFGMSGWITIFFLSRALEGLGAAACTPPLLAHISDITEHDPGLRARAMSYFELSLLVGLALGGLAGSQLWYRFHAGAFATVAFIYLLSGTLLFFGTGGSSSHGGREAIQGFWRALREPSLLHLAPAWLCVNSIVGLWLGPTLTFLLTQRSRNPQFLAGIFADHPQRVGWLMLCYSIVFGAGVTVWSFVLPRVPIVRALRIALLAMFVVCVGLFALNHSGTLTDGERLAIGVATALFVMVESGFTPAALSLLAGAVGAQAGRGAAMGIYSALLSIGAIGGSLLAAALSSLFAVDGLIYGTVAMTLVAIALLGRLRQAEVIHGRP